MSEVPRAHEITIRVRYSETDAMGVAHHSTYVPWLEESRIAMLRDLGHSYRELEANGVHMPVTRCEVRYRRALRFDDEVTLHTTVSVESPSRLKFSTEILHNSHKHATAEVEVATIDDDSRPARLPANLKEDIAAWIAGDR